MKIGVSSYSFSQYLRSGKLDLISVIKQAADMGFEGIEYTDLPGETFEERKALAEQIDRERGDAENLGRWDAWGGGGLLADAAKYDHLDKAGSMSQSLQKLLGAFHAELADVAVYADVQVEIDEFTRFADFFWDGIFVDFAVLDRIRSARWKMQELDKELDHVMENLRRLAMETDGALAANENAVRRLAAGENP